MATVPAIKGALLEEAILFLLRASGYRTVEIADVQRGTDSTLQFKPRSGDQIIEVRGRGAPHQIDAIADNLVPRAFSHPQRLLVEAKCYSRPVDIGVISNVVGVYRDICEYFNTADISTATSLPARYHYQYAIFSASGFTRRAQEYAYAHDIYLLTLKDNLNMKPAIVLIEQLTAAAFGIPENGSTTFSINELRQAVRTRIREPQSIDLANLGIANQAHTIIAQLCSICRSINASLLAMVDQRFPLFLTPNPSDWPGLREIFREESQFEVAIRRRSGAWFLQLLSHEKIELSFDVPQRLLELYSRQGYLAPEAALDLKQNHLSQIQAFLSRAYLSGIALEDFKLLNFRMDQDWFETATRRTGRRRGTKAGIVFRNTPSLSRRIDGSATDTEADE